jgi:hypothetical protein
MSHMRHGIGTRRKRREHSAAPLELLLNTAVKSGTVLALSMMSGMMSTTYLATAILLAFTGHALAAAEPPVPQSDLRAFLLEVAQRSRSTESEKESFESRYAFVHTKVTEERNPKGELKKREVERVPHHQGNPEPVPGGGRRSPAAGRSGNEDKAASREDFQVDAEILSRFHYTPRGEEIVHGRSQRVIDFEPAGDHLPVHSFKDKYINQTAGRLWIDEQALVLTRLQMRLLKPVNVWGGVLGAIAEFHFNLEREQTSEGDWYTRRVQWHLKGRRLFVGKIIDFREERTDVRRVD